MYIYERKKIYIITLFSEYRLNPTVNNEQTHVNKILRTQKEPHFATSAEQCLLCGAHSSPTAAEVIAGATLHILQPPKPLSFCI